MTMIYNKEFCWQISLNQVCLLRQKAKISKVNVSLIMRDKFPPREKINAEKGTFGFVKNSSTDYIKKRIEELMREKLYSKTEIYEEILKTQQCTKSTVFRFAEKISKEFNLELKRDKRYLLNKEDRIKIRELFKTGKYTSKELCARFGVDNKYIHNCTRSDRNKWKGKEND